MKTKGEQFIDMLDEYLTIRLDPEDDSHECNYGFAFLYLVFEFIANYHIIRKLRDR